MNHKLKHTDFDYCTKCWRKILNNRSEFRQKLSSSCKISSNREDVKEKIRKSLLGKNAGDRNGMKKPESRKKASESRKKIMTDDFRKRISDWTKKAWSDGSYDGVKVGKCKWYNFTDNNGKLHKLQGSYELKFAEWLDEHGFRFDSHKGIFKYEIDGNIHSYYPDFFVYGWNSYVEIKSDYHFQFAKEKMIKVVEQNTINLTVLLNKDLKQLGINL
jgi:hypothetical protein